MTYDDEMYSAFFCLFCRFLNKPKSKKTKRKVDTVNQHEVSIYLIYFSDNIEMVIGSVFSDNLKQGSIPKEGFVEFGNPDLLQG